MLHPLDSFRSLISEINDWKADLKKQRRRVKPSLGTIMGYRAIKEIAYPLNQIFKSNKYSKQTSIEMYCDALKRLHLLIQELRQYWCKELADSFQHLYNRLFVLLPENTAIQHHLFDTDCYHKETQKEPVKVQSFLDWLREYISNGFVRRDVERRRAIRRLNIVQSSLHLKLS